MKSDKKSEPVLSYIPETEISLQQEKELAHLLDECFPDTFDGRIYFKQLPHARVVMKLQGQLIGQLGFDFRIIRVDDQVVRVLGLIDLCVRPSLRSKGFAGELLKEAEKRAKTARADFLILFADKPDLYLRHGFAPVSPALIKWLGIDERQTCGILEKDYSEILMAKPMQDKPFPSGAIDMLGYLF